MACSYNLKDDMTQALLHHCAPDAQPSHLTGLDPELTQVDHQPALSPVQALQGRPQAPRGVGHNHFVVLEAPYIVTLKKTYIILNVIIFS